MTIAALLAFGALLAAWLAAPGERRHHVHVAPEPMPDLTTDAQAA
jgi:hypothetical protein